MAKTTSKRGSKGTAVDSTTAQQPAPQQPQQPAAQQPRSNPLAQQPLLRQPAIREYGVARAADLPHSPRKWAVLCAVWVAGGENASSAVTSSAVVLAGAGLLTPTHVRHYCYHASAGGLVGIAGGGGAGLFGGAGGGRGYAFYLTTPGLEYLAAHAGEAWVAQLQTAAPALWDAAQALATAVAAKRALDTQAAQQPAPPVAVKTKRGRKRS